MQSFRKTFRHISHMSGHCEIANAKCVILMFYSSIREDCLVVVVFFFGGGEMLLWCPFLFAFLAVRIGETGLVCPWGKWSKTNFF